MAGCQNEQRSSSGRSRIGSRCAQKKCGALDECVNIATRKLGWHSIHTCPRALPKFCCVCLSGLFLTFGTFKLFGVVGAKLFHGPCLMCHHQVESSSSKLVPCPAPRKIIIQPPPHDGGPCTTRRVHAPRGGGHPSSSPLSSSFNCPLLSQRPPSAPQRGRRLQRLAVGGDDEECSGYEGPPNPLFSPRRRRQQQ